MSAEIYSPQTIEDLHALFDIAIEEKLLQERFSDAIELDDITGQPELERIAQEDDTLLELVFLCDARAQVDNDDYAVVNEISWVGFAKDAIRRVAQRSPSMRGLDKMRMFADTSIWDQVGAYEDMSERRTIIKGSDESDFTGLEYALRVAHGEIVLE